MPMKEPHQNSDAVALKRERSYTIPTNKRPRVKKVKFDHPAIDPSEAVQLSIPLGTTWRNNSCVYDAVFVVLFDIWRENPASTSASWQGLQSELLDSLMTSFETHKSFQVDCITSRRFSLEQIRDFPR